METERTGVPDVVFYWRPGCPFCWILSHRLRRAGVALDKRNIWQAPDAAAFVRSVAGGNETVPTVAVGGSVFVNPPVKAVLARLGELDGHERRSPRRGRLRGLFRGLGG